MKVLVVGSGGREHALIWKLRQSSRIEQIFCAPGNAGIAAHAAGIDMAANDLLGLLKFAQTEKIDLTLVGPEQPLVEGIVDLFKQEGLKIFGPTKAAAQLEASKAFSKEFCFRHRIPTADASVFDDAGAALQYVKNAKHDLVVKADGLCAGKGVVVCSSRKEAETAVRAMMIDRIFGDAGAKVVIEERLEGEEVSFIAISDGNHVLPFASSQDHKRIFDGDRGPNTGGMGAYSPAPLMTGALHDRVIEEIMLPTVRGMVTDGSAFTGVLYAGLMICDGKPHVLEFNVRFGDPETQPLLARLKTDLVDIVDATIRGRLDQVLLEWDPRPAVCVVMASQGYPGSYEKGKKISGLDEASHMTDVTVFHAGTVKRNNTVVTDGGRVLGVTALGDDLKKAIAHTYEAVSTISWDGCHYRKDIGKKGLSYVIS